MKVLHTLGGRSRVRRLLTLCSTAAASLAMLCMSSTANADIYIDFGSVADVADTYGGAAGIAGTWNAISFPGGGPINESFLGLFDSNGVGSSVDVAVSASILTGTSDFVSPSAGDAALLDDDFYAIGGAAWSVTISGLQNGIYDVYYYAPSHSGVTTGSFQINGSNAIALTGGPAGLDQGVSWERMTGVDLTATDTVTFASTSTGGFRGLSGIQLIRAVPEPTTLPLMILGFVGYLGRRRRG